MNQMELKFSSTLANEALARNSIINFIAPLNPSLDLISEIKTIVSEAVSNAIIHGYQLDPTREVLIKASVFDDILEIAISDNGVGIEDVISALKPSFTTRPDLERAGMGLAIMQSLSDNFAITSAKDKGTRITIVKSLKAVQVEEDETNGTKTR